jgi:hypothetical protein
MVGFGVADADEDEDEDEDADADADEDGGADAYSGGADGVGCASSELIAGSMDVAAAANVWADTGWLITVYCDFFASSFTPISLNREEETTKPINHTKYIIIMRIHYNMTSTALFTRWQNDSRTRRDS